MSSKSDRLRTEIIEEINDAWLNINVKNSDLIRPLDILPKDDPLDFQRKLVWLMSQPEYFSFFCKQVLNIELLPFQALMLQELWIRKFPMLIGSRGMGKTFILGLYALLRALFLPERKIVVVGAAFRQSKYIHDYIENVWKNSPILRDMCDSGSRPIRDVDMCKMIINNSTISALPIGDGCLSPSTQTTFNDSFGYIVNTKKKIWGRKDFRDIDYYIDNGFTPTKIVTTKCGYSYESTYNHAMKVLRNNEIKWVRTDEMKVGDRILIDRSVRWHYGNFNCDIDQSYALGAMIGGGCWTDQYSLGFATQDREIIDRVNLGFKKIGQFNQQSDLVHWKLHGKQKITNWLKFWELDEKCYTNKKSLPINILSTNKENMIACLQGLFDTDGHVFVEKTKGGTTISVNFTNTSETLVKQIQYILLHFGIVSTLTSRQCKNWNRVYELAIYGKNVKVFAEQINFYLPRKRDILNQAISQRKRWNGFNDSIPLHPQQIINTLKKDRPDKFSNSKILKRKSFQQSFLKDLLLYAEDPFWGSLVNDDVYYDTITSIEDSNCNTYDVHIPDGNEYCANGFFSHNSKIRGQRAHDILADEFASMSIAIFENVISGFGVVSSSPAQNVKQYAARMKAKEFDIELIEDKASKIMSNQIVFSGTAFYDFNHFASYFKKWRSIINSKGDPRRLEELYPDGVPEAFDWRDYSIIRIPYDQLPRGFMDEGQIARSKATIHTGIFGMEFGAIFAKDSQGFFKRSMIEKCVAKKDEPIVLPSGPVFFDPILKGSPNKKYVIGVDPASEVDNFSIVVVEINPDHRRIVYVWTTNKKNHTEKLTSGLITENDFYGYCALKIRDLMNLFPTIRIAVDSQGGGFSIREALHNNAYIRTGELPIWEIIEDDKEKETDNKAGLHILEMCNFANYEWLATANHGMRHDFESQVLLFPQFDPVTVSLSLESDKVENRLYDTLEDCIMEVEELKNELSLIEMTKTPTGRDKWDTPEIKLTASKKSRMRKDRYSALLMANMAARVLMNTAVQAPYVGYGGFAERIQDAPKRVEFSGPEWFTSAVRDLY